MSFGKKTASTGMRTARPAPSAHATPHDESGSMLSGVLGGVVIGLAVLAGAGLLLMLSPLMSTDEQPGGAPAVKSGTAQPSHIGLDALCPAPGDAPRLARKPNDPPERKTEIILAEIRHASEVARRVTCAIQNARERLCMPAERAALVTEITSYLALRKSVISRVAGDMGMSRGALEALYADLMAKEGGRDAVIAKGSTMRVPPGFHELHDIMVVSPEMMSGLRSLIEDGYLAAGDLAGFMGMFMPAELEPHLAGASALGKACR